MEAHEILDDSLKDWKDIGSNHTNQRAPNANFVRLMMFLRMASHSFAMIEMQRTQPFPGVCYIQY